MSPENLILDTLSPAQLRVLAFLCWFVKKYERGPTMKEIHSWLGVSRSTYVNRVNNLVRRKWVQRVGNYYYPLKEARRAR